MIDVRMLGPLAVWRDGAEVPLGGARQRAVVARLALARGRAVSVDALIEDVWGGRPPRTATKTLQKYVSELRKVLGSEAIRTTTTGYQLATPLDAYDVERFERHIDAGEVDEALLMWRGDVLADLPELDVAIAERTRLNELRLAAIERRLEQAVDGGRHTEVVGELTELVAAHPLRERLHVLLLRALYRSGRHVDALRAFDRHRRWLAEEVGVAPGPELRALEQAILRDDPSLGPVRATCDAVTPSNVVRPLSRFVGRHAERRAIAAAVREHRLVTIVGTAGVGKTRLAVEVAADALQQADGACGGGVWWVDLVGVEDPNLVPQAIATALTVRVASADDDEQVLLAALAQRGPVFLVLDNCEHVVHACAHVVSRLLARCPQARVLATSRRPLGVDGEDVRPLAPLSADDAIALFTDRAGRAGVTYANEVDAAALVSLCDALDRLPLAIELAAGQVRALTLVDLADRLDERLRFRGRRRDAPARHRTLEEAVGWSYGLLAERERSVFLHLSVFSGTFDLHAATAVCGDDVLHAVVALIDHSMLVVEPDSRRGTRYRMLESLRLFATAELASSGHDDGARRAHARYYAELADDAGRRLYGPDEDLWADRLATEEPNLHAATTWARAHDLTLAARLGIALWPYWDLRWRERHAVPYLLAVLETGGDRLDPELRAWLLTAAADLAANPGEAARTVAWARDAVERFRRLDRPLGLASALSALGSACANAGALEEAAIALEEGIGIARRHDHAVLTARQLSLLAFVAAREGDVDRCLRLHRDELEVWGATGSRRGRATGLRHLAVAARAAGDLDAADEACDEALELWEASGDRPSIAHVRTTQADIARVRGDLERAERLYTEALGEILAIGDRRCTASTYKNFAAIALTRGDAARAAALLIEAIALRTELGDPVGHAECFEGLAVALGQRARHADAMALVAAAERVRRAHGAAPTSEDLAVAAHVRRAAAGLSAATIAAAERRGQQMDVSDVAALAASIR